MTTGHQILRKFDHLIIIKRKNTTKLHCTTLSLLKRWEMAALNANMIAHFQRCETSAETNAANKTMIYL